MASKCLAQEKVEDEYLYNIRGYRPEECRVLKNYKAATAAKKGLPRRRVCGTLGYIRAATAAK